jgi:uncharacterized protein YpiB (UPF0302 family)
MKTITSTKKREFIKWFLNHYQLKKRESVWILNYLLSDDKFIDRVHFVDSIEDKEKGIIMSTHCSGMDVVPFRFKLNDNITIEPEKAFHNIRANQDEDIYINVIFNDQMRSVNYLEVLEDELKYQLAEVTQFEKQSNDVAEYIEYKFKATRLKQQIDQSLADNDKELFMQLTSKLNSLQKVVKPYTTYRK